MKNATHLDEKVDILLMNKNAAELLSAAFIKIFNNADIRRYCENHLESETLNSLKRQEIYRKFKEPWQSVLWCFCSLNSKGSAKASREKWVLEFSRMSELINPEFLFKEFDKNEEKIFCAINLILRSFAGGRFLTVSKKYFGEQYKEFDSLEFPTRKDLVKIVSSNTLDLLSNNNIHVTASYKLFEIIKNSQFKVELINKSFNDLNIISISVDNLIERFSSYGISNKFARNIKMDILADNIEGYFAIDSRIQGILESIGYPKFNIDKDYNDIELFLNKILKEEKFLGKICFQYNNKQNILPKMTSWEFDRLLFFLSDSRNNILRFYLQGDSKKE